MAAPTNFFSLLQNADALHDSFGANFSPWARVVITTTWIVMQLIWQLTFIVFQSVLPILVAVESEDSGAWDSHPLLVSNRDGDVDSINNIDEKHNNRNICDDARDAAIAPTEKASLAEFSVDEKMQNMQDMQIDEEVNVPHARTVTSSLFSTCRVFVANLSYVGVCRATFVLVIIEAFMLIAKALLPETPSSHHRQLDTVWSLLAPVFNENLVLLAMMMLFCLSSTVGVHFVMSPSMNMSWDRLPSFRPTLKATARPIAVLCAANLVADSIITLVFAYLAAPIHSGHASDDSFSGDSTSDSTSFSMSFGMRCLALWLFAFVARTLIILPASLVLIRVEASLIRHDVSTIIPFDPSFKGRVAPANGAGRGYATMSDAWQSFSLSDWRRLAKMHVSCYIASVSLNAIVVVCAMPVILMATHFGLAE